MNSISHALSTSHEPINYPLIMKTATITTIAVLLLQRYYPLRWNESTREYAGRIALSFPLIQRLYQADVQKETASLKDKVREKWELFPPVRTQIPDYGFTIGKLMELTDLLSKPTLKMVQDKHLSGTIYSRSLINDRGSEVKAIPSTFPQGPFERLEYKLFQAYVYAYSKAYLWNSLHMDEFCVGPYLEYQVVRMVADMFGGKTDEVMGFVTSGGTESLMLAMRAYGNWGRRERGHGVGEGVVIACDTVHAAVMKGCEAYHLNLHLVKPDHEGRMDLVGLEAALKEHGINVVAIVGSTPSYPLGVIDPIEKMAALARKYECGMHVDGCLGGFIVNNLLQHKTDYLAIPGVTSLSADTHKNGEAPKGSSVIVTKEIEGKNLAAYSIYSIPNWSGGAYGTPKDAGSQSCVPALTAFLAMLGVGKLGYCEIAEAVHGTTVKLGSVVKKDFAGKLRLLAEPEVNVVAFDMDPAFGLEKGAIYAFAYEMKKRNFIFNALRDEAVHFCVTARFTEAEKGIQQFKEAVEQSLAAVEAHNQLVKDNKQRFPGDAGLYCSLDAAFTPKPTTLTVGKFVQNWLLGIRGAKEVTCAHFLAQLDPY